MMEETNVVVMMLSYLDVLPLNMSSAKVGGLKHWSTQRSLYHRQRRWKKQILSMRKQYQLYFRVGRNIPTSLKVKKKQTSCFYSFGDTRCFQLPGLSWKKSCFPYFAPSPEPSVRLESDLGRFGKATVLDDFRDLFHGPCCATFRDKRGSYVFS